MPEIRIDPSAVRFNVDPAVLAAQLSIRPLLVLLHGYGSHEADLMALAPELPERFVIASLRAPLPLGPGAQYGFAWYAIRNIGQPDVPALERATAAVFEWLDDLEARVPGGLREVALLGFSQGGCMVSMLMRTQADRFASGVLLSGFVATMTGANDDELRRLRPPVFWGRDRDDPVITPELISVTEAWLPEHSTLERREYSGTGHSISQEELDDINTFLQRTVKSLRE